MQIRGKYNLKELAILKVVEKKGVGRPISWGDILIFRYTFLLQFDLFSYIHQSK